jgi:hypothetical protein
MISGVGCHGAKLSEPGFLPKEIKQLSGGASPRAVNFVCAVVMSVPNTVNARVGVAKVALPVIAEVLLQQEEK